MYKRTDLAYELIEREKELSGIAKREEKRGNIFVSQIDIKEDSAAKILGKEKGKYITLHFPQIDKIADFESLKREIKNAVEGLLPKGFEELFVVGLGNDEITADAIGPKTTQKILATRHITEDLAVSVGLKGLKKVSVLAPDVLGKTGLEAAEIIRAIAEKTRPDAVVVIDALCAENADRIFKTVQASNTGISPGSGVKNSRKEISEKTIGARVISIGVPTVIEASFSSCEPSEGEGFRQTDLIVTPKDCDLLIHRMSEVLASALNYAFQPNIASEILDELV